MQALLSFENAPPFAAPLRFFVTAPLFVVLAGFLLLIEGPAALASRWTPAALAMTHLITVGFMLQVMCGALIQILPVVAGANIARPLRVAAITHAGLTIGALILAAGFHFMSPRLLTGGALVLALTVAVFLGAAARALLGVPSTSPTIRGLKLSLAGLFAVVSLGALMAEAIASGRAIPLPALADLHAAWGLGGWAGVLLVSVAYVVVPMFQLTPGYPARPAWWFPAILVALLLMWSMALVVDADWLIRLSQGMLALAGLAFAGLTMRLQAQRRRAKSDATHRYWQCGLASAMLALGMLLAAAIDTTLAEPPAWTTVFGVLLLGGAFLPFIIGMLYKIVPFLGWLHLQNLGELKVPAPGMNKLLADREMRYQFRAHLAALALLLAAMIFPEWLARLAGAGIVMAGGGLCFNLCSAVLRYRRLGTEIRLKLAALAAA